MSRVLTDLNSEMASIVEEVEHSLVLVRNGRSGSGTATIWHPDGLIITNAHVIGHSQLTVILEDRRSLPAKLLAYDSNLDLAALVVDAKGLPTIKIGDSRNLRAGQWVLALGNPWGVRGAATAGVVIGMGPIGTESPWIEREFVAVNLHLRPGYSGGPLLDVSGRLVGINTMMTGPDIGMAVPVHVVKRFLHDKMGSVKPVR